MYKLTPPALDSSEAFNAAVATIKASATRTIYQGAATTVAERCSTFDLIASTQQFDVARATNFEVSELTDPNTMASLYEKQFARGLHTQRFRDSIRNAAPNSRCPYCGDGVVAELDHYLPKSIFAGTAVHPLNLVPSCRDCNYAKKTYAPNVLNSAILHPYYDEAFDARWLKAILTLNQQNSPVVDFLVSLEPSNIQLENRLKAHLQVLDLERRFGLKAAQLINDFQAMLKSPLGQSMSLTEAQLHLRRQGTSYRDSGRINSWEAATYEAMLTSDWYLTKYLGLS